MFHEWTLLIAQVGGYTRNILQLLPTRVQLILIVPLQSQIEIIIH